MASVGRAAILVTMLLVATPASSADRLVHSQAEYQAAMAKIRPGDTIRLANGTWNDFRILLDARGTAEKPVTLTAETKGRVILTGVSDLRLSGAHLIVSGLVFKDGHAPGQELISFRRDSKNFATDSRLSEIVIDGFNKPDRRVEDIWVA